MKVKYIFGTICLPLWAEKALECIVRRAGLREITVTKGGVFPLQQAEIMYHTLCKVDHDAYINRQYRIYGEYAERIIRVFQNHMAFGETAEAVITAMEKEIVAAGPANVSAHCRAHPEYAVFDIEAESIPPEARAAFETAVKNTIGVKKFIPYPVDPVYHIELSI